MKKVLITVVILGLVAAGYLLVLPSLQKAKQKQTMADVRNVGTALMSWLTDQIGAAPTGPWQPEGPGRIVPEAAGHPFQHASLPLAAPSAQSQTTFDFTTFKQISYEELKKRLRPSDEFFYINEIPEKDGWGHPYEFYLNDNLLANQVMLIRSPGRDGTFSATGSYSTGTFEPSSFDEDIVWADGYFVRWPATPAQ